MVPGFVHSTIAAHDEVLGVAGILPKRVVVDVLVFFAKALKGGSAVLRPLGVGVHAVHRIGVVLGYNQLDVVVARSGVVAALAVGRTSVGAAVGSVPLDHEVVHVWIDGRNGEAKSAFVSARNSTLNFCPGFATVFGLPQAGFGSA